MKSTKEEQKLSEELTGMALDTVREVRNNKFLIPLFLGALCIAAAAIFATSILPLIKQAEGVGRAAGESSGYAAGLAVGSVEGATQGIQLGYEEGKEEGLSAKDTVAAIANKIKTNVNGLGRLEVLVANVELTTYHEVGTKYGALYLARGSAVFTVDLSNITVTHNDEIVSVVLPRPKAEISIDPAETKLLADWQRRFFNGTGSEGFQGHLNSFEAMKSVSEEKVANYPALLELASASAVKQVKEIAAAARGNTNVDVAVIIQSN